jgi:hypothetical protein
VAGRATNANDWPIFTFNTPNQLRLPNFPSKLQMNKKTEPQNSAGARATWRGSADLLFAACAIQWYLLAGAKNQRVAD